MMRMFYTQYLGKKYFILSQQFSKCETALKQSGFKTISAFLKNYVLIQILHIDILNIFLHNLPAFHHALLCFWWEERGSLLKIYHSKCRPTMIDCLSFSFYFFLESIAWQVYEKPFY